jgi:succinate dehydrogenase/fumarate reductase-like Fe-S protein
MSEELGVVKVFRFNPAVDQEPRYETFADVPFEGRTVIDVVRYVQENRDSTLSYRYSCRLGLCMACRMRVNGSPVVACKTLAEAEMLIEPPKSGRVIKDLLTTLDGEDEGVAEA